MAVVGRAHGVRGLVRLHSYTADPDALPDYAPLHDERGRQFAVRWHAPGIAALAEIVNGRDVPVADRSAAEKLVNLRLYADRDVLPPPDDEDEFYLADLVGLRAVMPDGTELGRVDAVPDHGGGPFLEIGPHAVPFTRACVPQVDIAGGRVVVLLPQAVDGETAKAAAE